MKYCDRCGYRGEEIDGTYICTYQVQAEDGPIWAGRIIRPVWLTGGHRMHLYHDGLCPKEKEEK